MKKLKSLKHSGILVLPKYKALGYQIKVKDKIVTLKDKTEEMAFAWCKKRGTEYEKDPLFRKNFFSDFCKELGVPYTEEINFDQLIFDLEKKKWNKEHMTKREKKKAREERKKLREKRKEKYGYAFVDGKKTEISNYIAEPNCIFMGRGKHSLRGSWKEGPREEDIILNLSPDAEKPKGNWKKIVWKPKKMYIAKWGDKLSGKVKYVWLSDSWNKKQEKEKEKFKKAQELAKELKKVKYHIGTALHSSNKERRKIASVCYLIYTLNLRVGDEKEEKGTVGAITLRPEHIKIDGNKVHLHFVGKDYVEWERDLIADPQFVKNLKEFMKCKDFLFEGITSKKVSKFLQEAIPGLTAKVFRTFKATRAVENYLLRAKIRKEYPLWAKKYIAKFANLEAARECNHKRKEPKKFKERLEKKKERIKKLSKVIAEKKEKKKEIEKDLERLAKYETDLNFTEASKEYTLGTSLRSYINPLVFRDWCKKVGLPPDKIYSETLLKKFSWCLK